MQRREPNRTRAAGIVIYDDALLLMFRRKGGREYYAFPGGGVEEGELPEDATVREIEEETTIKVNVEDLLYELRRKATMPLEYFYRCAYVSGAPALGSDSIERAIFDTEKNYFEPRWVKLSDVGSILLLPSEVAMQLSHDLEKGFQNMPVILKGATLG